jgi:hypothetical protein
VSPLAHEEIEELLGAYALHALDPDEAELVEQHLHECPRCRAEVADHREVATMLGHTGGTAPEGLWDRIASQLEEPPPPLRLGLPADAATVVPLASRRRYNRIVSAAVGAAAAVVIAVLGVQVVHQDDRIEDLEAAMDGSTVADASVARLVSDDGDMAVPAVLLPNGTGYLLTEDLPGLSEDRTYQLWGVTDRGVISLGLLGAEPGQVAPFQAGHEVSALAVTEEASPGVLSSKNPAVVAGEFG